MYNLPLEPSWLHQRLLKQKKKQEFIDNLDMLKSMSVEEQTLYKKWQEMNKGGKMAKVKNKLYNYRTNLWVPSDLDDLNHTIKQIEDLEPYVEMATPGKGVTEWVNYRKLIHTMEWVANPGRNMKFWVRDRKTNKVLGLICLGSDVTSIKVRDAYIGWDKVNKFEQHKLNNTAIATTICSTQPGGYNMLMGKLVAALTTCKTIRDEIEDYIKQNEDYKPELGYAVRVDQFSESSIDMYIRCFTKTDDWDEWLVVKEKLAIQIKQIVEKNKASFAFPSQSIYVEKK